MKKVSKPSVVIKPTPTQPPAKPLAAKSNKGISIPLKTPPKATVKSSPKPKPKEAQGQAALLPILERLALSAERLAQAAERRAVAPTPQPSAAAPAETADQGQAVLLPVVERLMQSTDKLAQMTDLLAQAADRLTEATRQKAQTSERHDETLKTPEVPEEEATGLAASHQEMVDAPDLIAPDGVNATDSKALEEYPGIPEPSEDE